MPRKACATLVALVALAAVGGCDQVKRGMHDAARDAAAASIDDHARDSVIGELQADFPQDYARLREAGAQEAANGGGYTGVRDVSKRFIVAFYAAHEPELEQAPAPALLRVTAANLGLLTAAHALGDDVCMNVWTSGATPGEDRSSPALKAALQALGQARVAAIRAGIDHPAARGPASRIEVPDAVAMVTAAGRFGVTPDEVAHAAHEAPAVGCRTGIAVYQGLQTLPPEQAARLQAHLLWGAVKPS